ncbi:MAG: hypothetical protein J0I12_16280 [Candidatus Eremiobacteraeota bacterium]|nr:hypothetical protein [Candidatus Eremiobacteraeota bacterium]
MLSSVMHSASPLALTRALASQTLRTPAPLPEFQDVFIACDHQHAAEEARPFSLLDNLSRVPTKCYYCNGSGKCQQDYPGPGSGKDWKGEAEYRCSGSGKCQQCGGSGWISTRYKVTMH